MSIIRTKSVASGRKTFAAPLGLSLLFLYSGVARAESTQSSQSPSLEAELQAAAVADKAGDYQTAAKHYQAFLDVDAGKVKMQALVEVRSRLGTLYFLLHQYRESLSTLAPITRDLNSAVPVPAQVWVVEGLDELEINELPEAIQALRQALKLNPASGTARLALGDASARSGNLAGAVEQYEEQLRRTPGEAEAWFKLGLAYGLLSNKTSSDFFQKYPQDTVGRQLKAEGLIAKGKFAEALHMLFPLLQESPHQAGLYSDLGAALLGLGFPRTAEPQFRRELVGNPHAPEAILGLLITTSLRGDWGSVVEQLGVLARSNPRELARLLESPPPAALRQALQQGLSEMPVQFAHTPAGAAWRDWLQSTEVDPSFISANAENPCSEAAPAQKLERGTWLSEACYRQLADQLRTREGFSRVQQDKLAEAELRAGNAESAQTVAAGALKSDPSDGWTMYWLVRSYDELGYEAFRKVSALNPNSARAHQMIAKFYADQHETSRAVTEYEAALKLSPDSPDLYLGLGTVYWEAGDWDSAEQQLRKALELAPNLPAAQYELGDVYVQKREWLLAIRDLRPTMGDETFNYQVCLDLSKAEAALGHIQQATDDLLRVAKQDENGELHYRLALLYRKLGDSTKAEAAMAVSTQLRQASAQYAQEVLQTMEKERQALEQLDH